MEEAFVIGLFLILIVQNVYLLVRNKQFKQKFRQNLLVDLELATSEQLLAELPNRNLSYIMLKPVETPDGGFTVKIECNRMTRHQVEEFMVQSAKMIMKENKKIDRS